MIAAVSGSRAAAVELASRPVAVTDLALYLAQLQLEDLDQEIGRALDRIKQRNASREAYARDLERIQRFQGMIPHGEDKGQIIGDVKSYDHDPGLGRVVRSPLIDGVKEAGGQTVARLDASGQPEPARLHDEGYASTTIEWHWNETIDQHAHMQPRAGEVRVPVYEVDRERLAQEATRIDNKMSELSSANEVDQIQLQRLMSRRQEAMQRFNNVLKSQHDAEQHVLARG